MSKSTPRGATAKFAAAGKPVAKKDLGLMAMMYGHVYVANVAMGANMAQVVRAFNEAAAYDGPSIIIAYSSCISHGIDMTYGMEEQKKAVTSGHWLLYRFDPRLAKEGKNPLQIDSKEPFTPLDEYRYGENRYMILKKADPERADMLSKLAQQDVTRLQKIYKSLVEISYREKEIFEKEMPVAVEVAKPEVDRQDVLLKGLESLANYYALGLESHQFYEELRYLETEARYHAERLGQIQQREQAISTVVQHLHVVDEVIVRYQYKKSALIQMLLGIQRQLHWLPRHTLKWLSMRLNIPLARIYSIADFYEAFSLVPQGEHLVQVCEGTACHVRGASELMDRVSPLLNIKPGETDADQVFTLQTVHCLGCCALAPVVKIDNEYYHNPNMNRLKKLFDSYREKRETLCHA